MPETKGQSYLTAPGFKAYYSLRNIVEFINILVINILYIPVPMLLCI